MVSHDEKRWLVAGLVLNKVLIPRIRSNVEQNVKAEYAKLVASKHIDTQVPVGRLNRWNVFLKYENINGNDGHKLRNGKLDCKKFNYHVTSPLDFAKLYVQPFMAKFSKFDECDASAILTLLEAVPVFSPATQSAAANVRQNVRNKWAHCDFAVWDELMYKKSFKEMDLLVRLLGLPNCLQVLSELKDWETKGENLIAWALVDQTLLTMAQQDIALLRNEVQLLKTNEYQQKVTLLTSLSDRLTALEKKVNENQTKIVANASEITANKRIIAANLKETAVNTSGIAANKAGITSNADEIESIKGKIAVDSKHVTYEIGEHASAIEDQENEIRSVSERIRCLEKRKIKMDSVGVNREYCPSADVPETNLPPMAPHFTGHEKEIDDLTARMASSPTQLFSIWGSGGFGKTSLAIAVGHRIQEQGIRVWFVSLRRVSTVEALIEKLLTFLGQTHFPVKSLAEALDCLCACFRALTSDTVLILDNVDELLLPTGDTNSKFLQSIQELLQASTNLRIVCTSRETMSYATLTRDVYNFRIGILQAAESVSLLHLLSGNLIGKEQESLHLAKVCGHVPLCLKFMARIMTQDRVLPSNIISNLATSNILKVIDIEDCPDDLRMQKIFEFSFSKLSAQCQDMFVSLTIFPGSFDAEAAAAVLGKERLSEVKKGLGVLERKSFLEYDESSARYTIHTLLQAFGEYLTGNKSEMNDCKEESRIRHHCYFIQLLKQLNESFLTGQSSDALHRFDKDRDNFIFCILDAVSSKRTYAKAADQLINMDLFLDTILWVDKPLSNTMYDNYLKRSEENMGRNSVHYVSFLLSKAFGFLHYRTSNRHADQLLSEAENVIQVLHSVPSSVITKYFCYLGFRKLILSQVEDGVAFLEKAVPLAVIPTETIVLQIVALRVLADHFVMKNKSDIATEKIQKGLLLCQNYETLKPIVVIQDAEEGDTDHIGNQQFLAQIFYFLSHFCSVTKSIAHVKDSLFLAVKKTDEQRETGKETLEMAQQYGVYGASLSSIGCTRKALEVHKKALDIRIKLLGMDNELSASSYHKIGRTFMRLREYSDALKFHRQALEIRLKLMGEDNEEVAWSYHNIGFTHSKLGDYINALNSHQHALDVRLKLHGKVNKDTAWSHSELGSTYFKMKEYDSALVSQKEALDILLKVFGREYGDTARSYHNIGVTYSKLGDYINALNSHQHALDIRLKLHGKDNKTTAWSYSELGSTYLKLENYDSALKSHKQALEIRLTLFGENSEDTAWSYDNIGVTHYNLGDYDSALYFHGLALDIRLKLLGEDNEDTALTYNNLGLTHYKLGKYTIALNSHRHALDIRLKLFEEDNKNTAWSYNNLGVTQEKLEDYRGAVNSHRHALDIRLKLFGKYNEDTVLSYIKSGVTFYKLGDYKNALISHEEALDIQLKLFGKDNKHTAWGYNELGLTHFKLRDYRSALDCHKHALCIRLKLHGEDNKDTAKSYTNIAVTHYKLVDYSSALEFHKHALDIRLKILGEDNNDTAWSYNELGQTCFQLKDYINALKFHRLALGIRLKLLKIDQLETAWSYNNMGLTQHKLEDYNSALNCHGRALGIRLKILGEDDLNTAWSYNNIGVIYEKLGDYDSALYSHIHARDIRLKLFGEDNKQTTWSNNHIRRISTKLQGFHKV